MYLKRTAQLMLTLLVTTTVLLGLWLLTASAEAAPVQQTSTPRVCRTGSSVVTNTDNDGPGSLRFEIALVQQCLGGGNIRFAPELSGETFTLTSPITVTEGITVSAETPTGTLDISISGNNATRLFTVDTEGALTLDRLTLRDGSADFGGAIHNAGTLTLTQSTVVSNTATVNGGALYNTGLTTLEQTTIANNSAAATGGGIRNEAAILTIRNSHIEGNTSTFSGGGIRMDEDGVANIHNSAIVSNTGTVGGGIFVNSRDTLTLTQSTVSHNTATQRGGGLFFAGLVMVEHSTIANNSANQNGGGVHFNPTRPTSGFMLINSTISSNAANTVGNGIDAEGDFEILNSTIVSNTGGNAGINLRSGAHITLTNGIVAFNAGADCVSADNLFSVSHSLVADGSCGIIDGADGNLIADPLMLPLAQNGGATLTHALIPNSPARNVADNAVCPAVDQRGVDRSDGLCDIGAYEDERNFDLTIVDGNGQGTLVGTGFAEALAINLSRVAPLIPSGIEGETVTFTAPASGPSLAVPEFTATTDANGNVTEAIIANDIAGTFDVVASTNDMQVTFTLTNTCIPAVTVTNGDDSGAGSLRQALFDVCPDGTVSFSDTLTVTLATRLSVNKPVTVTGTPHDVTIEGNDSTDIVRINSAGDLTLAHLTILDGQRAVQNSGMLTIDTVYFASNFNSTISNSGHAFVTNSTFFDNNTGPGGDGTINNSGTITVTNTLFKDNNSRRGAGIFNGDSGTAHVSNSTFSGGFSTNGTKRGAGVHNRGVMTITHSTFVGNKTGNGTIDVLRGSVALFNSVLADNVTDCRGNITVSVGNWVDANSCNRDFGGDPLLAPLGEYGGPTETYALQLDSGLHQAVSTNCAADDGRGVARGSTCDIGAFESQGVAVTVVSGDGQSAEINTTFVEPLVLTASEIDPAEPLIDLSTVITFRAPDSGASLATPAFTATIDASGTISSGLLTANEVAGTYNVTASLAGIDATFTLTNTAPPCVPTALVLNVADSGTGSLRAAVGAVCDGGTITFDEPMTVTLTSEIIIDKRITIAGIEADTRDASTAVTISGDDRTRIFNIRSSSALTLTHLTLANGVSTAGGAIISSGDLTIDSSRLVNNRALLPVRSENGSIRGGLFGAGGAIYSQSDQLMVRGSQFVSNMAVTSGGGVFLFGSAEITATSFISNSASTGGGIANLFGNVMATNLTISGNSATGDGGGVWSTGTWRMTDSDVLSNTASGNGAGLALTNSTNTIERVTIVNNVATGNGGGIYFDDAVFCGPTRGCRAADGTQTSQGGGSSILISASTIADNQGANGAGIYNSDFLQMLASTVSGNQATTNGGGLYNRGSAELENCTISSNQAAASDSVGGIYSNSRFAGPIRNTARDGADAAGFPATLTLNHCTVTNNNGGAVGGILQADDSEPLLAANIIAGNIGSTTNEIALPDTTTPVRGGGSGPSRENVLGQLGQSNADAFNNFTPGDSDFVATDDGMPTALSSILNTTLADNGGPTLTHALPSGSPALERALSCSVFDDQRGVPRAVGGACDAGAFESELLPTAVALSLVHISITEQTTATSRLLLGLVVAVLVTVYLIVPTPVKQSLRTDVESTG